MKYRLSLLFSVIILCGFAACKQNYAVPGTPNHPPALDVVNSTTDTLDYFINGTRQNNTSDIYIGGATNYVPAFFGTGSYSLKKAGKQAVIFKQPYTLDTTTNYSLFICGETADKIFMLTDNLVPAYKIDTAIGVAAVRFINASPNAGNVDIVVNTGSVVSLKNCAFKSVSSFYALKDTVNEVKVYPTGTTTPIFDGTFFLSGNQPYTIFTTGTPGNNAATSTFKAVLISNVGGY